MIKNIIVKLKLQNKNISYYRNKLNNFNLNIGDSIDVNVDNLSKGTHINIISICDVCGIEKEMEYRIYNKLVERDINNKYYCKKCASVKVSNTLEERYGFRHALQFEEFLKKMKNTNIQKSKYDFSIIREKKKNTMIERYGSEHALQNDILMKKSQNTKKIGTIKTYTKRGVDIMNIEGNIHTLNCKNGHNFEINIHNLINRINYNVDLCTICNPIEKKISNREKQLFEFILDNVDAKRNYRIDKKEIDIFIPELKLGFEFNGLFWHNENYRDRNYHLDKTEFFEERGIKLVHIYEDDWIYKKDIVKSMILKLLNILNEVDTKQCKAKMASVTESKKFLNENHIYGYINSKINIGLYVDDELVSLMGFNRNKNNYKMNFYCSKLNCDIINGEKKLLNYFINNYNPNEIVFFDNRSWSNVDLYNKLGFRLVEKTNPNRYYIIDGKRVKKSDNMKKYNKIYDSGNLKFKKVLH